MYKGYRFVWFMGVPLSIGLALSAGSFVPWFFGERYEKVIPLIEVLSLLILAIGINGITGAQYLIPTQRENIYTITVVIGACTNFALNCVLINRYQSMGAAVASVLAETVIAVVQLVMVRSELSIVRIIKEGVNYYVAGGVMAAVLMVVRKMVMPTVAGTLTMVSVGAAIYFGMLLIMRDGFLLSNIKMIFRKFKRG
jgi:O-antigen/teichoic acid export membrane protein